MTVKWSKRETPLMRLVRGLVAGSVFALFALLVYLFSDRLLDPESGLAISVVFVSIGCALALSLGLTMIHGRIAGIGFATAAFGLGFVLVEWPFGRPIQLTGAASSDGFNGAQVPATLFLFLGFIAANHFVGMVLADTPKPTSTDNLDGS